MNEELKPLINTFLDDLRQGKAQSAKKNLAEIVNKKIEIKNKIIEDNLELLKKKSK